MESAVIPVHLHAFNETSTATLILRAWTTFWRFNGGILLCNAYMTLCTSLSELQPWQAIHTDD